MTPAESFDRAQPVIVVLGVMTVAWLCWLAPLYGA